MMCINVNIIYLVDMEFQMQIYVSNIIKFEFFCQCAAVKLNCSALKKDLFQEYKLFTVDSPHLHFDLCVIRQQ